MQKPRNGWVQIVTVWKSIDQAVLHRTFETTVNYDKDFGGTNLAILGGYSYQYFFNEGFGMQGGNFLTRCNG